MLQMRRAHRGKSSSTSTTRSAPQASLRPRGQARSTLADAVRKFWAGALTGLSTFAADASARCRCSCSGRSCTRSRRRSPVRCPGGRVRRGARSAHLPYLAISRPLIDRYACHPTCSSRAAAAEAPERSDAMPSCSLYLERRGAGLRTRIPSRGGAFASIHRLTTQSVSLEPTTPVDPTQTGALGVRSQTPRRLRAQVSGRCLLANRPPGAPPMIPDRFRRRSSRAARLSDRATRLRSPSSCTRLPLRRRCRATTPRSEIMASCSPAPQRTACSARASASPATAARCHGWLLTYRIVGTAVLRRHRQAHAPQHPHGRIASWHCSASARQQARDHRTTHLTRPAHP